MVTQLAFDKLAVIATTNFGIRLTGRKKKLKERFLAATSGVVTKGIRSLFKDIETVAAEKYDANMQKIWSSMLSLSSKVESLEQQVDENKTTQDGEIAGLAKSLHLMQKSLDEESQKRKRLSNELKDHAKYLKDIASKQGEQEDAIRASVAASAAAQATADEALAK
eukprot:305769-Prymnesium_polylepis.1